MRAPTTSWWWKLTAAAGERPRLRLARRRGTTRRGARSAPAGCCARRRSCARARPCACGSGSCSSRIWLSSGRNSSERPVSARNQSPAVGSSTSSSFDSSSRIRSALTISSRWRSSIDRRDQRRVGRQPELRDEARGAEHAQRIVEERHLGRERRAQPTRGEVGRAAERVDEHGLREPQRHRVDGEVAPREVGLDVVGEHDLGLAALGAVHLGAERRDLERGAVLATADGAEPLTLQPDRVGPRPHEPLHHVGPGVGRDVDVGLLAVAASRGRGRRRGRSRRRGSTRDRTRSAGARAAARATSGVEQRPEAGRDRGHRHHSRRLGTGHRGNNGLASPGPSACSGTFAGVDGAVTCSRLGCNEPAVACSPSTPADPSCGSTPSTRPGRGAGVLCLHATPTGCPHPAAGPSSTGAARSRGSGSARPRRRRPRPQAAS